MSDPLVRVCFVCLGNICRSPTAEGVVRHHAARAGLAERLVLDSAGTGDWHVGEPPDERASAAAARRGIVVDGAARQVKRADFERFDYVLAMDRTNERSLLRMATTDAARAKVRLFRSFDATAPDGAEVPDPYYGGDEGFDEVLDICERAALGFLEHLRREHGL